MGTITTVLMVSTVVLLTIGLVLGIQWFVRRWRMVTAANRAGLPTAVAVDLVRLTEGVASRETKVYPAGPAPMSVFGAFVDLVQAAAPPGLAELQARDPGFQATDFLSRVVAVVALVRETQRTGHPDQASGVMSDRLYNRWKAGATMSAPDPSFVQRGLWIAEARSGEAGDSVAVRMQENVVLATNRAFWVFVRSRGARPRPSAGGAVCPNCGAPVPPETATCPFCHAAMFRNQAEWVLDDVVPAAEWKGLSSRAEGHPDGRSASSSPQSYVQQKIEPKWPYGIFGRVITVTGQQLVCRQRFRPARTIPFQSVAQVVLCGIDEGQLVHPAIFFFDAAGKCLLWVYADQYKVSDFDLLFQKMGIAPVGSWKDWVPIGKIAARFPGAFDEKAA
jgi:hypothetical protein